MEIGHRTISALVARMENHGADYANEYGEPGYQRVGTAGVVLGYYWCHCDHGPETDEERQADLDTGRSHLHSLDYHYPRVFAALEEQGWKLEWSDEWWIDHETGKAWRTRPDSYGWQSSIIWCDGEYLTPDHDLDTWIEWAANDPESRCIPSRVWSAGDLRGAGFVQWEPNDPHQYESGWHPGQTDDPREIVEQIREQLGEQVEVVFLLDATGQFDVAFSAWTRGAVVRDVDAVLHHYIIAALWSSVDDDDEPMDRNYSRDDIAPESIDAMRVDVVRACRETATLEGVDAWTDDQFGHDLWLTRNGHGAGFWDREFGTDGLGELLSDVAHELGESTLYVGDDGYLYVI